jgi:hypothetical protein
MDEARCQNNLKAVLAGKPGLPTTASLHSVTHRRQLPLGFTVDFVP